MPFHIEISSSVNRVRVFNLDREELSDKLLEPWIAGLPFEFGDREWAPRESRLTILEGPVVVHTDNEEDWESTQRAAEDVTRPLLEAAEARAPNLSAAVVEADSIPAALKQLRDGRGPRQIPWAAAVKRINDRDPEVTAVLLVVRPGGLNLPQL